MPTTDPNPIALRATIAAEIRAAKQHFPPKHHKALDSIGRTLDLIPPNAVPDFIRLDADAKGAITAMIREDMLSIAEQGALSDTVTASTYVEELTIFIDKLRLDQIEWLAHKNRRTLDRRRIHDA
jgi:hypothetical protein